MGQPQMPRDERGRFSTVSASKKARAPKPREEAVQRFSRLHSAIRARNVREAAMSFSLPSGGKPVFDDIYDLYVHYEK